MKTAFIIGAGASKAYSLPTGEDLRQEIFNMRVNYGIFENQIFSSWYNREKYISFIDTFKLSGQKSIDTFLKTHPEFENEGKACIAYIIKTHEQDDYINLYKKNDWLFYLYNKLVDGIMNPDEQFVSNNFYFITFNYDRLLEYYLITSLYHSYKSNKQICSIYDKNGLSNIYEYYKFDIDHVYGKIGDLNTNPIDQNNVENIPKYMNELKIVGDRAPHIDKIKNKLEKMERIFFLGYGFDTNNNELLELKRYCAMKKVYGTCYKQFDEEINKIRPNIANSAMLVNCSCNDLLRKYF